MLCRCLNFRIQKLQDVASFEKSLRIVHFQIGLSEGGDMFARHRGRRYDGRPDSCCIECTFGRL